MSCYAQHAHIGWQCDDESRGGSARDMSAAIGWEEKMLSKQTPTRRWAHPLMTPWTTWCEVQLQLATSKKESSRLLFVNIPHLLSAREDIITNNLSS